MKHNPELPQPPLERIYDLNRLSEAGYDTRIVAGEEDCARIAAWADVSAVRRFEAEVSLKRLSPARFAYAARLKSEIVQSCTVTLEPVYSDLDLTIGRTLHLISHVRKAPDLTTLELNPASGDDDVPEEIESPHYDLAAPLLEEFLLAIDPYPRAPGVVFEAPAEAEDRPESPFAVLRNLKAED